MTVISDPYRLHGERRRDSDEVTPLGLPLRRFFTDGSKVAREGHCRMCLRPGHVRQLSRHHLIPQRWFRQQGERVYVLRNAAANIVPLCRACHDEIETGPTRLASRRMLRRALTQEEVAFVIDVRGLRWLETRYPQAA